MFRDITALLQDAPTFNHTIELLLERYRDKNIQMVELESQKLFLANTQSPQEYKAQFCWN